MSQDEATTVEAQEADDEQEPVEQAAAEQAAAPFLRVVRGDPSDQEIAALVAVLASLGGQTTPVPRRRPEWAAAYRQAGAPLAPGAGAWRASALPR